MKKFFILTFIICLALFANAQYETPGTGVQWRFDDLVEHSEGVVTLDDGSYVIHKNLTISATDLIIVVSDITVKLEEDVQIIVNGGYAGLLIHAPKQVVFTALDKDKKYGVIDIQEGSIVSLNGVLLEYGKGIKVIESSFKISNSTIQEMDYTSNTSGAISGTRGKIHVENCRFINNQRAALSSGANMGTTFTILNSYFYNNTTENSNRPQINIGPCQEYDTTYIIGNTVIGTDKDKVGGIGCSSLLGVESCYVVEGNTVKNNRYGITITGNNVSGLIKNNQVIDNNLETNPNVGGSGINITATKNTHVDITGNVITGNLWGITLVRSGSGDGPTCNLGNLTAGKNYNVGYNKFNNNGNGGNLYDFYNNTPNDIMAQNNIWGVDEQTEAKIETVISHKPDDANLGTVTFLPAYTNLHLKPERLKSKAVINLEETADIELRWERPMPIFEKIQYNIYRNNELISTIDTVYFVQTDVAQGIYNYCVKALYEDKTESEAACTTVVVDPCYQPSDLTAEVDNDCLVTLTWKGRNEEELYDVYMNGTRVAEKIDATTFSMTTDKNVWVIWYVMSACGEKNSFLTIATSKCDPVSLTEQEDLKSVNIYPNPANSVIHVSGENISKVEIYNLTGQMVDSRTSNYSSIDISSYNTGMYFFKIYAPDNSVVTKRIMVSK